MHVEFGWHDKKALQNKKKHGVTFDDAAAVLADTHSGRFHVEIYDDKHSDEEDRHITIGSHPYDRSIILVISWTDRSDEDGPLTWIISARAANKAERKRYEQHFRGG